MNENINLCEILKDCPKGTKLYSPLFGEVNFYSTNSDYVRDCPILVCTAATNCSHSFRNNGTINFGYSNGEIMLYPSKDQRDWSKWKCPKPKKPKFDPKTLKTFQRVLAASMADGRWVCDFFSHIGESIRDDSRLYVGTGFGAYDRMIPYNDDTKHLVGTSDEAPEYYRYWEN